MKNWLLCTSLLAGLPAQQSPVFITWPPIGDRGVLYSSLFVKKNDSIGKIQKNVTKLQKKQIKKLK